MDRGWEWWYTPVILTTQEVGGQEDHGSRPAQVKKN
jgi:hypothetical protein